jgi:hypothetical protein
MRNCFSSSIDFPQSSQALLLVKYKNVSQQMTEFLVKHFAEQTLNV